MSFSAAMLLLTSLLAQGGVDPFWGVVPSDVPTFRVTLQDSAGSREVYVGIQQSREWVREERPQFSQSSRLDLFVDAPWAPEAAISRSFSSRLNFYYEPSNSREQRIRRGWEAQGFTLLETNAGRVPVLASELRLAERARELEKQAAAALSRVPAAPQAPAAATDPAPAPPRTLQDYLPHAGVLLAGFVLLALVGKFLLFSSDGWQSVR